MQHRIGWGVRNLSSMMEEIEKPSETIPVPSLMTTTGTDKYDLVLHCTGFGPFSGVPENPTSMLMQTLPSQLSLGDTPLPPSVKCASFTVLETSFQGSRSQLDEIYETGLLASNGGHTIYLHIGMHFLLSNSLHCLAWFSESET